MSADNLDRAITNYSFTKVQLAQFADSILLLCASFD